MRYVLNGPLKDAGIKGVLIKREPNSPRQLFFLSEFYLFCLNKKKKHSTYILNKFTIFFLHCMFISASLPWMGCFLILPKLIVVSCSYVHTMFTKLIYITELHNNTSDQLQKVRELSQPSSPLNLPTHPQALGLQYRIGISF